MRHLDDMKFTFWIFPKCFHGFVCNRKPKLHNAIFIASYTNNTFAHEISWPNEVEWRTLMSINPHSPCCIKIIDGMFVKIWNLKERKICQMVQRLQEAALYERFFIHLDLGYPGAYHDQFFCWEYFSIFVDLFCSTIYFISNLSLPIIHILCSTIHVALILVICHNTISALLMINLIFPLEFGKHNLCTCK